jgi:hypothetical protein
MQDLYLKNKIAYFPYRKLYLGTKLFPVSRCRYKNAHVKERELRNELYTQYKKFKKIKWRERLLREMRQKGYRTDQG